MAASTPRELIDDFFAKFNAADIEGVLAHYESDAAFVDEPGKVVHGTDAIRESLNNFFALKPNLTNVKTETILAGDIGTNHTKWKLTGTGPDGEPVSMEGVAIDIIRRQPDGTWKMVIDNPWGPAILE